MFNSTISASQNACLGYVKQTDVILSIIIPVYNVAPFVGRCLQSVMHSPEEVLAQCEIVVVDDGSTDGSSQIIDAVANTWSGIRVIRQANQGLGCARNRGIDEARGSYLWFIDGDDFVLPGALPFILTRLSSSDINVLAVDFTCASEDGTPIQWITTSWSGTAQSRMTAGEFYRTHFHDSYMSLFIARADLFHGVKFKPRINMQDSEILPRLLEKAEHVELLGAPAYVYVKRATSFVNSKDSNIRDRYFRSVVSVHEMIKQTSAQLDPAQQGLIAGVDAKLAAIRQILLLTYIYESPSPDIRRRWLALLRSSELFPFDFPISARLSPGRVRMLRPLANLFPVVLPRLLDALRYAKRVIYNKRQAV